MKELEEEAKAGITEFFDTVRKLDKAGVIRSSSYTADIAEYICQELFDLKLEDSQREVGFDAEYKNGSKKKVQIKINNSSQRTNQYIGDKTKYDELYLLITENSKLFIKPQEVRETAFILIYKFNRGDLPDSEYLAKSALKRGEIVGVLDCCLNTIMA